VVSSVVKTALVHRDTMIGNKIYLESECIAKHGRCGYVLYRCIRIALQHPYPYPADE
jgi:hypothetical protein